MQGERQDFNIIRITPSNKSTGLRYSASVGFAFHQGKRQRSHGEQQSVRGKPLLARQNDGVFLFLGKSELW